MYLQCPECKTKYLVPDQAIGASGRNVRCAQCKHSWFVAANAESAKLGDLGAMVENIQAKPIPPGSNLPAVARKKLPAGSIAATLLMGAAAAALALFVFKPAMFGFPPSAGFALTEVEMASRTKDKKPIYEISGKIINKSDQALPVPVVRITAVDNEGSALQYWDFSDDHKTLEAGKEQPFNSGTLEMRFSKASRFVVELGSPLELALRRKPE